MPTDIISDKTMTGRLVTRLGRYTLKQRLGVGGMAEVYLAEQDGPQQFKKRVVVKRILPSLAADASFVAMFVREAQVAARLTHTHVVQIYELGEEKNEDGSVEYFIAMEHIDGLTLQRLAQASWATGSALPVDIVLRTGADAARGLHAAHTLRDDDGNGLGLVHRDISPDNLMVSKDGVTKVLDFGIAKGASPDDRVQKTKTGQLRGKVPYLAPEQVGGRALDGRTDLWSLGVSMYWLLCGARPFDRASDFHTMAAILSDVPKPPRDLNPAVPLALERLILSMMAKDPADRPGSGADVADKLEELTPQNSNAGRKPTAAFVERFVHSDVAAGNPLSEAGDDTSGRPPSSLPPAVAGAPPTDGAPKSIVDDDDASFPLADVQKTRVAPWPPTGMPSEAPAIAPATPATEGVVAKHPVVVMLAPPRERSTLPALLAIGAVTLILGGGGFALSRRSLTSPLGSSRSGGDRGLPPAAGIDAGFVAVFADARPKAIVDAGTLVVPPPTVIDAGVGAPSSRFTLRARGPARIEWRSEQGALFGRGSLALSLPHGMTTIIAVDPKRRMDVKMPVHKGKVLDYDKLPSGTLQPKQVEGTKIFIGGDLIEGNSPVRVVAGTYDVRVTRGTRILSKKKIEFTTGAAVDVDAANP